MNKEFAESLRRNWYLGAVAGGCVVLGITMGLRGDNTPVTEAAQTMDMSVTSSNPAHTINTAASTPWANLQTKDQHVKTSIQEYRHKIHEEDVTEDTDMDIMRLGNLYYSRLLEYNEAATYYEMLLQKYPDFEMASIVYQNLAECYKRLGDTSNERNTYRRMMNHFPQGTNENDFARNKMGQ